MEIFEIVLFSVWPINIMYHIRRKIYSNNNFTLVSKDPLNKRVKYFFADCSLINPDEL